MKVRIDVGAVIAELRDRGSSVVPDFLNRDEIEAVERQGRWLAAEGASLVEEDPGWLKTPDFEGGKGFVIAFRPAYIHKYGLFDAVSSISQVFSAKPIVEISQKYLGWNWNNVSTVLDYRTDVRNPLCGWHSDYGERNRTCLKFFIYLSDTDTGQGAFEFIPRSHRLSKALMARAGSPDQCRKRLHDYNNYRREAEAFVHDLDVRGERGEAKTWRVLLDEIDGHVKGALDSDDYYSVPGKAGTLIVFDSHGVHRGGMQKVGNRFVLRAHHVHNRWPASKGERNATFRRLLTRALRPPTEAYFQ